MKHLLFLFLAVLTVSGQAQRLHVRPIEAGFLVGFTNYSGDLSEHNIEPRETRFGYGGYIRHYLHPKFSVKAHLYSGKITGDDKHNESLTFRKYRYYTTLFELGGVGEWQILGEDRISNTGIFRFQVTPYLFAGLGLTISKPEAECYGTNDECEDVSLLDFPEPDLRTRYLTIPIGGGIRADLAERLVFCTEIGWRPVFSDKLDGISLNANPDKGDWYYFFGATIAYVLNDPHRFRRKL